MIKFSFWLISGQKISFDMATAKKNHNNYILMQKGRSMYSIMSVCMSSLKGLVRSKDNLILSSTNGR